MKWGLACVVVWALASAWSASAQEFEPIGVELFAVFDFGGVGATVLGLAAGALGAFAVVALGVGFGQSFLQWLGGDRLDFHGRQDLTTRQINGYRRQGYTVITGETGRDGRIESYVARR
jgi:hypothetical protein